MESTSTKKVRINYCIGTWSGQRARIDFNDSFIRQHIKHLNTLKHEMSQISIGHPKNPTETSEYTEYIRNLSSLDDGTPIVVHDMKNKAMSYGQWSRMFLRYKNEFTHYIFIEDDYVPVVNRFDEIFIEMLEEKCKSCNNLGYLCGLVFDDKITRYKRKHKTRHAGISNGIATAETLQAIIDKFGHLVPDSAAPMNAQVVFSSLFSESGFEILDYLDQYQAPYYSNGNHLRIYEPNQENFIIPIQCLDAKTTWDITTITKHNQTKSLHSHFCI